MKVNPNYPWVVDTFFGVPVYLCVTEKAFKHLQSKLFGRNDKAIQATEAFGRTSTYYKDGGKNMVQVVEIDRAKINGKNKRERCYGVLLHEMIHVHQNIMEWIGEKKPGDEIEAYFIEALTRASWDFMNACEQAERTKK